MPNIITITSYLLSYSSCSLLIVSRLIHHYFIPIISRYLIHNSLSLFTFILNDHIIAYDHVIRLHSILCTFLHLIHSYLTIILCTLITLNLLLFNLTLFLCSSYVWLHQVLGKALTPYPLLSPSFSLLYFFHILYPGMEISHNIRGCRGLHGGKYTRATYWIRVQPSLTGVSRNSQANKINTMNKQSGCCKSTPLHYRFSHSTK